MLTSTIFQCFQLCVMFKCKFEFNLRLRGCYCYYFASAFREIVDVRRFPV